MMRRARPIARKEVCLDEPVWVWCLTPDGFVVDRPSLGVLLETHGLLSRLTQRLNTLLVELYRQLVLVSLQRLIDDVVVLRFIQ